MTITISLIVQWAHASTIIFCPCLLLPFCLNEEFCGADGGLGCWGSKRGVGVCVCLWGWYSCNCCDLNDGKQWHCCPHNQSHIDTGLFVLLFPPPPIYIHTHTHIRAICSSIRAIGSRMAPSRLDWHGFPSLGGNCKKQRTLGQWLRDSLWHLRSQAWKESFVSSLRFPTCYIILPLIHTCEMLWKLFRCDLGAR